MATSVVVRTFELATGEQVSSRAMKLDRKGWDWLQRNMVWAINHGKGIQVFNVNDEGLIEGEADAKP